MGGEKRLVTIMMADLRGFTTIGERLPAESVVSIINIFLEKMVEIILTYRGTIDEFIGDSILALFGAPLKGDDDAVIVQALRCGMLLNGVDIPTHGGLTMAAHSKRDVDQTVQSFEKTLKAMGRDGLV